MRETPQRAARPPCDASRQGDRPAAAGRAAAARAPARRALHRRPHARGRGARRPAAQREGKLATVDVLGEEVASAGEAARDRGAYQRRPRADRARRARREHLGQAHRARARARRRRSAARTSRRSSRTPRARGNFVRIDMEDSPTTDATLGFYRDLRASGHDERRRRAPGLLCAARSPTSGARERPALQGDLPRAARARLPRPRRDPRQLPRDARRAARRRRATSPSRPTTSC